MKKRHSLVIASSDYGYIRTFEENLIQKFADICDIQIITNPSYLRRFFSEKKTIDVLVIDIQNYRDFVEKQRVLKTFLVVPEVELGKKYPEGAKIMTRYLPEEEIFRQIEDAFDEIEEELMLPSHDGGSNTSVITVCSPIGGSGKSLVALGLAEALQRFGKKTLLLGCDATQGLYEYLPLYGYADKRLADQLRNPGEDTYWTILQNVTVHDFSFIKPFASLPSVMGVGGEEWNVLVSEVVARRDFDFLILDIGFPVEGPAAEVYEKSDCIVVTTESNETADRHLSRVLRDAPSGIRGKIMKICNDMNHDGMVYSRPGGCFGFLRHHRSWSEVAEDPLFEKAARRLIGLL